MSNLSDHIVLNNVVRRTLSLAHSALPDAPVVPDIPRDSIVTRARRAVSVTSRFVVRPTPDVTQDPATAQG